MADPHSPPILVSARVGPPSSDLQELLTQAADVTIDSASATFSVGDAAHPGALYDLSLFYKQGWRRNWRLADGLLAEAAQRGWPDAQVGWPTVSYVHSAWGHCQDSDNSPPAPPSAPPGPSPPPPRPPCSTSCCPFADPPRVTH